jgi:anti-anti-sigma regulatory factor
VREAVTAAYVRAVDLSAVTFLDSTGARLVFELSDRFAQELIVVAPPGTPARRALDLSGFTEMLAVADAPELSAEPPA